MSPIAPAGNPLFACSLTTSAKKPPSDRRCTRMSGKAFDARAEQTRSKRMDGGRENGYCDSEAEMKKRSTESWLHYISRVLQDLIRDRHDAKYWAGIFGMTGSASLAVAFIEANSFAFYAGIICCLFGLRLNRKGGNDA